MYISDVMHSIQDTDIDEALQLIIIKQKNLFDIADDNIKHSQKKQVEQYNRRKGVIEYKFVEGNEVLRRNMKQKTKKGHKNEDRWLGPYTITAITKTTCQLKNSSGRILKTHVNLQQLKPYLDLVNSTVEKEVCML